MKSNFLKLSYFAIAATGLLSACNQENISSDIVNPDKALTISVNPSDFIPVDAESRAVTADDLSSTTFENGDELGLFVISTNSDNMVYYDNVKFTYDGAQWTPEKEIYSYRYSKYVAYYPYNAELSLEDKTAAGITGSIKNAFAASIPADQSTADAFEKADLLLAEGVETDGAVTFDLKHQFSLVEIKVPVQKYITAKGYGTSQEEFTYNAPFVLGWYSPLSINDKEITLYNAGKGVLRYIFNPEESNSIHIEGYVKYEEAPYNFGQADAYTLSLTAGQYKRYNVIVPGVGERVIERDLEVGDYYYSDGSIYPYGNQSDNDENNPLVEGCIGVIYDVDNGISETEWNHASVISIETAGSNKWDNWTSGNYGTSDNLFTAPEYGYQTSIDCAAKYEKAACATAIKFVGDNNKYKAPSLVSSGWYLPSAWQILRFMKGFGVDVDAEDFAPFNKNSQKNNAITNFNKAEQIILGSDADTMSGIWLTSTESDASNVWAIEWKSGNTYFLTRPRSTSCVVRPVLSF